MIFQEIWVICSNVFSWIYVTDANQKSFTATSKLGNRIKSAGERSGLWDGCETTTVLFFTRNLVDGECHVYTTIICIEVENS